MLLRARERFVTLRDAFGPTASSLLVLFSAAAVSLFVFGQIMHSANFSVFGYPWKLVESRTQAFIWAAFMTVFVVYSSTSHRSFLNYTRKWWLEAIICVTWLPLNETILSSHLHSPLSLQTLLLIGSVAHILRVAKWTTARFSEHAIVVIGVGAASMVLVTSALLMVVEPQTYKSFEETVFSVYMGALTMGPTAWPTTSAGRLVFFFIASFGVTTVALFIAVMREFVQRFFGHRDISEQLLSIMKATFDAVQSLHNGTNAALLKQVESQQATIAVLQEQLACNQQTIRVLQEALATKNASP